MITWLPINPGVGGASGHDSVVITWSMEDENRETIYFQHDVDNLRLRGATETTPLAMVLAYGPDAPWGNQGTTLIPEVELDNLPGGVPRPVSVLEMDLVGWGELILANQELGVGLRSVIPLLEEG